QLLPDRTDAATHVGVRGARRAHTTHAGGRFRRANGSALSSPTPATGPLAPADATVVVITWNGAHLLPECLDSVRGEGARVLVVDNASTDGTIPLLEQHYPWVELVRSAANVGFAGGVALALEHVRTPVVVLLNNDAQVRAGWLA